MISLHAFRYKNHPSCSDRFCRFDFICALTFLAVLALSFYFFPTQGALAKEETAEEKQALPVEAVQIETTTVRQELTVIGSLLANESVVIAPEVSGRVSEISFEEGDPVEKEQVLLRLDPSVPAAERDRAQASLELSEANIKRADVLLEDQAISQRERDEALAQWRLDQANLRLAEAQLAKTVLRAPFSGMVGLRQVSVGEYMQPGEAVVNLEDVDPIKVDFRIPEGFSDKVLVGQSVAIRVDAVAEGVFEGQVYAIDPKVDVNGRALLLRARIPNENGPLRPGMFARVRLVLEEKPDALMIPEQALVAQGSRQLVYKVVDDKVEIVPVEIGLRQAGKVEITQGLKKGDWVITAGQIKVGPGADVKILPASDSPEEN